MTTYEAYEYAIEQVMKLKSSGIKAIIKPSVNKNDKYFTDKHDLNEGISPKLWCNIKFTIDKDGDLEDIHSIASHLGLCGITFDSGCFLAETPVIFEWQFDWSFRYKTGSEDMDMKLARDEVQEFIIKHINKK